MPMNIWHVQPVWLLTPKIQSNLIFKKKEMKYTLLVTQRCNLACRYCYIGKQDASMPIEIAAKIIDFIYNFTPENELIEIGFFGGEPFLEYERLQAIIMMIKQHKSFGERVVLRLVSNGILFTCDIAEYLKQQLIGFGISCDGPPDVHDRYRVFFDGRGSSKIVEENLKNALSIFPFMPVNAVYSYDTYSRLPETVEYLVSLGVKNIHLNVNISSSWTEREAEKIQDVYDEIGQKYLDYYLQGEPKYISIIDSKITVLLRNGYKPEERCRMGDGEFAFSTSGNVYPCERLVGSGADTVHCLGNITRGFDAKASCCRKSNNVANPQCRDCSVKDFCMNWCGCTNYFSTRDYNRVGPFICASEKASIRTALDIIQRTRDEGLIFSNHLVGTPLMSIIGEVMS